MKIVAAICSTLFLCAGTCFAEDISVSVNGYSPQLTQLPAQVSGTVDLAKGYRFKRGEVDIYLNGVLTCQLKPWRVSPNKAVFRSKKIIFANGIEKDECDAVLSASGFVREVVVHTSAVATLANSQLKTLEHETSFSAAIPGSQTSNLTPCTGDKIVQPKIAGNAAAAILNTELQFVGLRLNKQAADIRLKALNTDGNRAFALPYIGVAVNGVFLKKEFAKDLTHFERNEQGIVQDPRVDPFIALNKGPAGRLQVYIRRLDSKVLHESISTVTIEPALAANALIDRDEKRVCFSEVSTGVITLPVLQAN